MSPNTNPMADAYAAKQALAKAAMKTEEEDTMEGKYLSFPLDKGLYGIEIRHVTEVLRYQEITEVPHMPIFIKGVLNLRGQVIPTMDVRTRFQLSFRDYDDRTCIIVVNIKNVFVGLIVDTVTGVVSIPGNHVEPPPQLKKSPEARFISGMGKLKDKVHIIVNVNKLLYEEELAQIAL